MSTIQIEKRLIYIIAFLFVALPVIVGVIVWHVTVSPNSGNGVGDHEAGRSNKSESFSLAGLSAVSLDDSSNKTKERSRDERRQFASMNASSPKPTATISALSEISSAPIHTVLSSDPSEAASETWVTWRFLNYQVPVHYDITLYPDFYDDHATFSGNETVQLKLTNITKYILLHVHRLEVKVTAMKDKVTQQELRVSRTFLDEERMLLVVEVEEWIEADSEVVLGLHFSGSLRGSSAGLHLTSYLDSLTGHRRWLMSSVLKPANARQMFPCMDEPALTAQFTVSVVHRPGYTALSNMPATGESAPWPADDRLLITRFQRSVTMSTSLVSVVVCDLLYIEDVIESRIQVRVYASPDKLNQTQYALQVAIHALLDYEQVLNLSYPLPKLDLVAVPGHGREATESWGLSVFGEPSLLCDPRWTVSKQQVAFTVARQVALQWVGSLVTAARRDDRWLGEGLSSYLAYISTNNMEPRWQMMSQLLIDDVQPAMETDAEMTAHPLVYDSQSPTEMGVSFDDLSRSKGVAIIKMLETIVGKARLLQGLSQYLNKNMWRVAEAAELWASLSQVEGAPDVRSFMGAWARQSGFPYVNLTFVESQENGSSRKILASQARFLTTTEANVSQDDSSFAYKRWYISLDCVTSGGGRETITVLNMTDAFLKLDVSSFSLGSSWVKCNIDQAGFFRVNYPSSNWRQLSAMLKSTKVKDWALSPADRSGLLSDAFSLAKAGLLDYDVALEMTSYLHREDSFLPWQSASAALSYVSSMLTQDVLYGRWRRFVLSLVRPALQRLGFNDTGSPEQKRLRGTLLDMACQHEDAACLKFASGAFRSWLSREDGRKPAFSQRSSVYRWGMAFAGTPADWDSLWRRYELEVQPQEKLELLKALSMARQPWLAVRLLTRALEAHSDLHPSDFVLIVGSLARNPASRLTLWQWLLQHNQTELVDKLSLSDRDLAGVVLAVTEGFNSQPLKEQVAAFFDRLPATDGSRKQRARAMEKIDQNIVWMQHRRSFLAQWLQLAYPDDVLL